MAVQDFALDCSQVRLLWLAGQGELWQSKPEEKAADLYHHHDQSESTEPIHDRMPVILDERTADDWMNLWRGELLRLKSLLVAPPDDRPQV